MSYFYSLGITFSTLAAAEKCKEAFEKYQIVLSDSTIIQSSISIEKVDWADEYILGFYPDGFCIPYPNRKLFYKPYFYEVRKQIYEFLYQLDLNFNVAWWEFEAADRLKDDDVLLAIQESGIGLPQIGDPNASYFSELEPNYYESKRQIDGLILSEKYIKPFINDIPEFVQFKKGYLWIPVIIN